MVRKRFGNELHPVYSRYRAMLNRCFNKKHSSYKNYGEKGITVSKDLMPFINYKNYVCSLAGYDDDLAKHKKISLDRIDVNKGYEKGNLRWTSYNVQLANQSHSGKGSNKYTGINWSVTHNRWVARVSFKGKVLFSRTFLTEKEAYDARVSFIKENKLPHFIQPWID